MQKNSLEKYPNFLSFVSVVYGLISIAIALIEVNFVYGLKKNIDYFNLSKETFITNTLSSITFPFIFIIIALFLAILWYRKKRNRASKLCVSLVLLSVAIFCGLFVYIIL